jgi:hypothetical protein
MKKLIIAISVVLLTSCEEKNPIKKGDVMVWIDYTNAFHPINDTITILDIKGDYCLYEKSYKDYKYKESNRVKWIKKIYTKIK